ncbi:DUF4388 domain-containing protein [Myxococcota bacterium]|nr:DUF4388 domain-containing protein [Myxococcota bacterium]MBU1382594.1 DUF4388 domain-containing protein [Myxococcota bacterium]MBU1495811.1 DUF4388 domain-containing protein [Myxococcota bacterium]
MAITGSISDIGIIDLIQFPHNKKKTGEMIIVNEDLGEIRCNYVDGRLVNVKTDYKTGLEGLVEIIDLTSGEFEFRNQTTDPEILIDMDLHRAIMVALKLKDENKKKSKELELLKNINFDHLYKLLENIIEKSGNFIHYAVLSSAGVAFKYWSSPEASNDFEAIESTVSQFWTSIKRFSPGKLLLETSDFLISSISAGDHVQIVFFSPVGVSPGAVTMALSKIIASVRGES